MLYSPIRGQASAPGDWWSNRYCATTVLSTSPPGDLVSYHVSGARVTDQGHAPPVEAAPGFISRRSHTDTSAVDVFRLFLHDSLGVPICVRLLLRQHDSPRAEVSTSPLALGGDLGGGSSHESEAVLLRK